MEVTVSLASTNTPDFTVLFQSRPDAPLHNGDFDVVHQARILADRTLCGVERSRTANFQKGYHAIGCVGCRMERDRLERES